LYQLLQTLSGEQILLYILGIPLAMKASSVIRNILVKDLLSSKMQSLKQNPILFDQYVRMLYSFVYLEYDDYIHYG